ncbi:MAG TPA: hypothetical protein VFY93_00820 [Planctomycetota bacterium]|nr:hypothetical protein [Planctomycetota bacterium]
MRVETDGSPAARYAADVVRRHAVLLTGVALPETGHAPALRFERSDDPGYVITPKGLVRGSDLARAAWDILASWGVRPPDPPVSRREALAIEPRTWKPARVLYTERLDPSFPAQGIAVRGLGAYRPNPLARDLGYEVRVASTSFDDFLSPALFEAHPEWFAKRGGERGPRGNFALLDAGARAAYLDALGLWLGEHPEVDCMGIWPEVTTVWDEDALAAGAPESYALLWREAAARFPERRFEILATGLTLRPPAEGAVPGNVEVRLVPGADASGLQGVVGQPIEQVARAWETRGARVVLEIDAQPDAFLGMPWPCQEAIRENARRFGAAVLKGGGHLEARIWRDPDAPLDLPPLLARAAERARGVRSSGDPRDAADLFLEEDFGLGFRVGAVERLYRLAADEAGDPAGRRSAAADLLLGYEAVRRELGPVDRASYDRHRGREYGALLAALLPGGVERAVGPARVRETFARVEVETDRLLLGIDRRSAAVVSVRRKLATGFGEDLAGGEGTFFAVVALAEEADHVENELRVEAVEDRVHVELSGRLRPGGPRWRSTLELASGSATVRQTASVEVDGGIAAGCAWKGKAFDRWVCPAYAAEGRLEGEGSGEPPPKNLALPQGTLLYCRAGERGAGIAARLPDGGIVSLLVRDTTTLVVGHPTARTLRADWIVFTDLGELGK